MTRLKSLGRRTGFPADAWRKSDEVTAWGTFRLPLVGEGFAEAARARDARAEQQLMANGARPIRTGRMPVLNAGE